MNKITIAVLICLVLASTVLAQDWRDVDNNGTGFDCDLVDTLAEEYGEENILRADVDDFTSLAEFLDMLFPACSSQNLDPVAEEDASEEEPKVIFALYDNVTHEWGEPECSILIDDFYSEDFTLLIGGEGLDGIAVDVYLPDESQAIETEIVFVDVTESGLPLRRERIEGDEFPLGTYNFDVHIDDETYHFAWLRNDNAYNTVSLVCVDRQTASDDGERGIETGTAMSEALILDDGNEVTALLPADARYSIDEKDCSVLINDRIVGDFNLSITGHRQDKMSVDVYLPGEAEPLEMDHVHNYTVDVGGLTPVRTEWAVGESFPMGWYTFDVHIEDATYRFQWLRQDDAYNTFGLTCLFAPENEDGEYVYHLADGSSLELANSACSVFSITWESEFRIIAGGARHTDIQIDVYFPGEESPAAFDSSEVNALESGTPFRLDTIVGEAFPLGLYKLVVTIGEQTYQIAWDRQDPVYNTVGASCIVNG